MLDLKFILGSSSSSYTVEKIQSIRVDQISQKQPHTNKLTRGKRKRERRIKITTFIIYILLFAYYATFIIPAKQRKTTPFHIFILSLRKFSKKKSPTRSIKI
jgi:hypothetical protein